MTPSEGRPTGRLSLTHAQRAVADELFARLNSSELATLAKELPYTAVAAAALWGHGARRVDPGNFANVIGDGQGLSAASDHRRYLVAAYCACAGQNGMAKLLLEMVELKKRELAIVNKIGGMVRMGADLKLPLFLAAFAPKLAEEEPDENGDRVGE